MHRPTIATAFSIALLLLTSVSVPAQEKRAEQSYRRTITKDYLRSSATQRYSPLQKCKVCVEWAQGSPGTFAGPCVRYEERPCTTPPVVR